ncbi:hypothetical protein [Streptomyces sp. NPDC093261]|uniref:hypothetical protein n=1 Tax=Streptomyces sp. NPDC093261 TaxID=3366037 RepID=UPI003830B632
MRNPTKRMSVAIASLALAGGAVLGAGGTASAAPSTPGHVQRVAAGVEANRDRWGGHHDYGWNRDDHRCGRDRDHRWGRDDDYGWGGRHDCRWDRRNDCRCDHGISYLWDGRHGWRHDGTSHYRVSHYNHERHGTDR